MPITKTGIKALEINPSSALEKLIKYEQEQLAQNGNVIHENAFLPIWIFRKCPNCLEIMKKVDDIFRCRKCGLIKVPKGVNYQKEDEN